MTSRITLVVATYLIVECLFEYLTFRDTYSGKGKCIAYLFVGESIQDFFLKNSQFFFHLRIDISLGVRDVSTRECVADLIALCCVLHI